MAAQGRGRGRASNLRPSRRAPRGSRRAHPEAAACLLLLRLAAPASAKRPSPWRSPGVAAAVGARTRRGAATVKTPASLRSPPGPRTGPAPAVVPAGLRPHQLPSSSAAASASAPTSCLDLCTVWCLGSFASSLSALDRRESFQTCPLHSCWSYGKR